MTFELNKTYQDGLGRDVRIIATDAKHLGGPIIGLVTAPDGVEMLEAYRENGTIYGSAKSNLILPPVITIKYLVLGTKGYQDRAPVNIEPSQSCIRLTYKDGILDEVEILRKNRLAGVL